MDLALLGAAIVAIAVVLWDGFLRDRRGRQLGVSVVALTLLLGGAVAQGAEVDGPWALIALVLGSVLSVVSGRGQKTTS